MAVWVARAGRFGVDEEFALEANCVVLGHASELNLSRYTVKDELRAAYVGIEPNASQIRIGIIVGQLWRFRTSMQVGDLVLMPPAPAQRHCGWENQWPVRV